MKMTGLEVEFMPREDIIWIRRSTKSVKDFKGEVWTAGSTPMLSRAEIAEFAELMVKDMVKLAPLTAHSRIYLLFQDEYLLMRFEQILLAGMCSFPWRKYSLYYLLYPQN